MARSRRSRASSTPRFDAASSSTTSRFTVPPQIRVHESHSPHGSPAAERRSQLSAIARIRAAVVLPTPRGPAKRYPCATRFWATAPRRAAATWSWTMRSANRRGRYFLARAIIAENVTRARRLRAPALRPPESPLGVVDRRAQRLLAGSAAGVQRPAQRDAPHIVGHQLGLDGHHAAAEAEAVELASVEEPHPVVVVAHGLCERVGERVEADERRARRRRHRGWGMERPPER